MTKPNKRSAAAIDIEVGGRIRLRRLELSMSQTELGKKIGLTFQQVQKYEKGANRVGASRLQQIADALGVAPAYFFAPPPAGFAAEAAKDGFHLADALADRAAFELLRAFSRIADGVHRQAVLDLARTLAPPQDRRRERGPKARTMGVRNGRDRPAVRHLHG